MPFSCVNSIIYISIEHLTRTKRKRIHETWRAQNELIIILFPKKEILIKKKESQAQEWRVGQQQNA